MQRYAEELPRMRELAAVPVYDTRPVVFRQVSRDSHISYGGVAYSVHPLAVGHSVTLRPDGDHVGQALHVYLEDRPAGDAARDPPRTPGGGPPAHPQAWACPPATEGAPLPPTSRRRTGGRDATSVGL